MALAHQANGTYASSTSDSLTVPWPTHQAGDIGYLFVEVEGTISAQYPSWPPTNWTELAPAVSFGTNSRLYSAWKRAAGNSEIDADIIWAAAPNHSYGKICTYRGALASGTPHQTPVTNAGNVAAGGTITSSSITPGATGIMPVYVVARDDDSATANFSTWTGPTTMTEETEGGTTSGNGGGWGLADGTITTSTGATNFGVKSARAVNYASIAFFVKPQPTTGQAAFFLNFI